MSLPPRVYPQPPQQRLATARDAEHVALRGWRQAAIHTPLGRMVAVIDSQDALLRLDFEDDDNRLLLANLLDALPTDTRAAAAIATQVNEYFSGRRRHFDLALAPQGSAFQQRAWRQLMQIPFASTHSYGEVARQLQPPSSARAVGRANALNPISIIIPCHRVLGAQGALTGYSGQLRRKAELLALEADVVRKQGVRQRQS